MHDGFRREEIGVGVQTHSEATLDYAQRLSDRPGDVVLDRLAPRVQLAVLGYFRKGLGQCASSDLLPKRKRNRWRCPEPGRKKSRTFRPPAPMGAATLNAPMDGEFLLPSRWPRASLWRVRPSLAERPFGPNSPRARVWSLSLLHRPTFFFLGQRFMPFLPCQAMDKSYRRPYRRVK
jgi:hypothetical protein